MCKGRLPIKGRRRKAIAVRDLILIPLPVETKECIFSIFRHVGTSQRVSQSFVELYNGVLVDPRSVQV